MSKVKTYFCLATAALAMAEVPAVKAAASFLSNFINLSREQPALLSTVQTEGEGLVSVMLRCIGKDIYFMMLHTYNHWVKVC